MVKSRTKKAVVGGLLSLASLTGVAAIAPGTANAAHPYCEGGGRNGNGYLCFVDYGRAWGGVSGTNSWWGNFGWNDRADTFYNRGASFNTRIHADINFSGESHTIGLGGVYTWYDTVSSNSWYR